MRLLVLLLMLWVWHGKCSTSQVEADASSRIGTRSTTFDTVDPNGKIDGDDGVDPIDNLTISYVLEPFENADTGTWFQDAENITRAELSIVHGGEGALFGNGSFQVRVNFSRSNYSSIYSFGSILEDRPYNCYGATYLSLWYKVLDVRDDETALNLHLSLFDDSECYLRNNTAPCNRQADLNRSLLATKSIDSNSHHWKEMKIMWNGDEQDQNIRRIRGFRVDLEGHSNTTNTSTATVLFDQLACHGGGDLLGGSLYIGPRFSYKDAVSQALWTDSYYQSEISRNQTNVTLQGGVFDIAYTIQQVETWGGFVNFDLMCPGQAYFNLTGATNIALDYHVKRVSDAPGRAIFRFLLMDGSDCMEYCDQNPIYNELHWSFNPILDEAQKGIVSLPLISSVDTGQPFWLTGWSGILGNRQLDIEYIKGFSFELVLDSQLQRGDLVSGEVAFSNVRAERIAPGRDGNSTHQVGRCVEESYLNFRTETAPFRRVEFVGNRCCETCAKDPECIYGLSTGRDCYIASYLEPQQIEVRAKPSEKEDIHTFWTDDPAKRGDFCDQCNCNMATFTIDCRGADLVIPPILISDTDTDNNNVWSPRVLDLRENPRLLVLGSGALSSVAMTLEMLLLPKNLRYIAHWEPEDLPKLQFVEFEDPHQDPDKHAVSPSFVNAITQPSELFQDVCCAPGRHIELAAPTTGLSFCNISKASPGIDAVYDPFMKYMHASNLKSLKPSSDFLAEAAETSHKCAEICAIVDDCKYFEYDARWPNAEHICHLLGDNGTHAERVCCDFRHYADENMTIAGVISGRPPQTRREVDNARVRISHQELQANRANDFTAEYQLSLGSTPLRGAVWITPKLVSTTMLSVAIRPDRVVLYDANSSATVQVTLQEIPPGSNPANLIIRNEITSCDVAYMSFSEEKGISENTVYLEVNAPDDSSRANLAVALSVPAIVTALIALFIYFFLEIRQRKNDSVWLIQEQDLVFGDPPEILGRGSFGLVLLAKYRSTRVAVKRVLPRREDKAFCRWEGTQRTNRHESFDFKLEDSERYRESGNFGTSTWSGQSKGTASGETVLGSGGFQRMNKNDAVQWNHLKKDFIREMRYISKLRHPCVVTIMGAVIPLSKENIEPMLVMECMDHGSLYDLLHNKTVLLQGSALLPIMRDIAQGISFLHLADPPLIHGDLKAANCLVDGKLRAKVADFGLSQKRSMGATGTPYWMAPELLRKESTNTVASDVYAFGIILYEVYSRSEPYEGEDPMEVLKLVADKNIRKRPPIPAACPAWIQALMKDCLCEDPAQRPTFEEIDKRLRRTDAESVEPDQTTLKFKRRSPALNRSETGGSRSSKRTSITLFDLFPAHIAESLSQGKAIEPEHHDCVSVFFSDVVNYTNISSSLHATKVANMLDRLYLKFDELSKRHDVYKVETIGDAYIATTNLVKEQPSCHVSRIAQFSIDAVAAASETLIDEDDPSRGYVQIRVGFHVGPVVADVIGDRNPKFCILGDTVNIASRMESNSKANRIQCSERAAELLSHQSSTRIRLSPRGSIPIKGKGEMLTYWVDGECDRDSSRRVTAGVMVEVESNKESTATDEPNKIILEVGEEGNAAKFSDGQLEIEAPDRQSCDAVLPTTNQIDDDVVLK